MPLVLYIAALLLVLRKLDRKLTWTRVLLVVQHHHSFQTRSLWRERVHTSIWALRVLALLREERPNMICACIAQTTSHTSLKTPAKDHQKKSKSKSHIIQTSLTQTGGDLVFVKSGVMFGHREAWKYTKQYAAGCQSWVICRIQKSHSMFRDSWWKVTCSLQHCRITIFCCWFVIYAFWNVRLNFSSREMHLSENMTNLMCFPMYMLHTFLIIYDLFAYSHP